MSDIVVEHFKLNAEGTNCYYVHFRHDKSIRQISFSVYYSTLYYDEKDDYKSPRYGYRDESDGCLIESHDASCELAFSGTCQSRGDIESRIYPPNDEEWWGEDFMSNAAVFKDHILSYCTNILEPEICKEKNDG